MAKPRSWGEKASAERREKEKDLGKQKRGQRWGERLADDRRKGRDGGNWDQGKSKDMMVAGPKCTCPTVTIGRIKYKNGHSRSCTVCN